MPSISLPYGKESVDFPLPDDWQVQVLEPGDVKGLEDPRAAVEAELDRLDDRLLSPPDDGNRRVAIAVNDKTRPVPHDILVPPLLERLEPRGWKRKDITFVIAVGAHDPMLPEEFGTVLPDGITRGCRIVSHNADDPDNLLSLGTTALGTPVSINRHFREAGLRIVIGNIEPHQFMGWSGGSKSAAIGLASRQTISANHSMMNLPGAGPCEYEENPVRQDVEEMGRIIGVHLALNVVMNSRKEIVTVLAGGPVDVMDRGIATGRDLFTVSTDGPADLVIAAAGGSPKDINLYQAQKALRHGARAAAHGAPVIIVAACDDGIGSSHYGEWMKGKESHTEVREAFESEDFRLGPHKGMLVAADAEERTVILLSRLPARVAGELLFEPADSAGNALDFLKRSGLMAGIRNVVVLPYGNSTIPLVRKGRS